MAHCTPPAETISLEISAVFEAGGKKRGTHMNNIGVSSCSTVGKLLLIQYHRVYVKDWRTLMHRPLHRSLHLLHSRPSSQGSKRTIHHFGGERMSSQSMTTNGLILQDTPASKHIFIRTTSIQALKKARNRWYSKPNSSLYLLLSQNVNGRSLRHFKINVIPHPCK